LYARNQKRTPDGGDSGRGRPGRTRTGWAIRTSLGIAAVALLAAAADARVVTDAAGRAVTVPDRVKRVQAAGPPATVLLYALASEKLIGWVRKPREAELAFLNPVVSDIRPRTREFYRLFYQVDLNDTDLDRLLPATPGGK
jgi:ABC-type Fe3+-hydroxamate transport system substrate-binding protein